MLYKLGNSQPDTKQSQFVAASAELIGAVVLAKGSSVWFNCVLRADNEPIYIGENSNVQDGSILHVDPGFPIRVGKGVTIGHKAMLHGCSIGDNSLIGINSVILNGCTIGENCVIGAHALLTENTHIPENSLVLGAPAKIVKIVDQATVDALKTGADHYVQNGLRYANELTLITKEA